jgi:alginate O-acetyltransferase complex protein AlgI
MVFSSVVFLFIFLPIILLIYFIVPKRFRAIRNSVLVIFSLIFYAYGEPKYISIMLLSILVNYIFGYTTEYTKYKKVSVLLAVIINVGILGYFKYTNFLIMNFNSIFNSDIAIQKIVMPIGISFFTFQGLSYVLDIYKGAAKAQKNPLNVMLYISLFPELLSGPIVRYQTIESQISSRDENAEDFVSGIVRFMIGLAKKMLLANQVAIIADQIFALKASELTVPLAWLGAISYSLQIYFDFSGYSDMAIGLAKVFGFHFLENFNYPYISKSISEFWRRWHISLSTWFKEYIYIPLGGNRVSNMRYFRNIFVIWMLTGIWHGAAWSFVFWGLYFGCIIALEKFVLGDLLKKLWKPVQHLYALFFIIIGWVIFRSPTLSAGFNFIKVMLGFSGNWGTDQLLVYYLHDYIIILLVAIVAALPVKDYFIKKISAMHSERFKDFILYGLRNVYALILFIISFFYIIGSTFNPFIYFRF